MVEDEVKKLLETELRDAEVEIVRDDHDDPRSDGAHLGIRVVSPDFEGESKVDRHRRIHGVLDDLIGDEVHAVELDVRTPDEAS